ncbi:MAG: hypothetical protein DCF31_01935 [Alphaproteobacteria bacterium]|nr:MAG: hypothetical protein DCF31_01935 [Alphaproteobacteria bacterium]
MRTPGLVTIAMLAMLGAPACNEDRGPPAVATATDPAPRRRIERLFWSGHSLIDRPLPDYLAAVAASLDQPVQWNMQVIPGSSIKSRSRGTEAWGGYRQGSNHLGSELDVAAELASPRTVAGGPYDALIITEQHSLLGSLVWNDTIRHLRHFHDRAIAGNAGQTTYLYQSWLGIDDRDDLRRWIAYERAAATAWRCVATRINVSLAATKRPDRIVPIDAGAALATFVERVLAGRLPSLAGPPRTVIDQIFEDDVHLTPLGTYFVALFVFAEMSGTRPTGAWAPDAINPARAQDLQDAAWTIHRERAGALQSPSLDVCRGYVGGPFLQHYLAYMRDKQVRDEGRMRAYIRWLKHRLAFARVFSRQDVRNPLVFDAAADSDYWLSEI